MELLCQRIGITKAFKGKGEVRRLALQAGVGLERIEAQMRQLARASKLDSTFHYLVLHRRRTPYGATCCLRWRTPLHQHVPWRNVAQDLARLPVGLHEAYRDLNRRAAELNVLYGLFYGQQRKLDALARSRAAEKERRMPAESRRQSGGEALRRRTEDTGSATNTRRNWE